jgi:hypothetical protein
MRATGGNRNYLRRSRASTKMRDFGSPSGRDLSPARVRRDCGIGRRTKEPLNILVTIEKDEMVHALRKNSLTRYFSNISQDSNTFKTLQRKYINLTSTGTRHRLYSLAEVEQAVDLRLLRSELLSVVGGTFPKARNLHSNRGSRVSSSCASSFNSLQAFVDFTPASPANSR